MKRGWKEPSDCEDPGRIDESLWKEDYDVLVIQGLRLAPIRSLIGVWNDIKAKKVHVFHEGILPAYESFYRLEFDAIVVFDDRYRGMLSRRYPLDGIQVISYPCHPVVRGDKLTARKKTWSSRAAKSSSSHLATNYHRSMATICL